MARTPQVPSATPPLLKNLNERRVLETIRADAPISRAQISRRAGISKPTVSLALQSLLDSGLVRETSPDPGRPSYGATFFEPVAEAALVLGLDLGARFLRGAICDLEGAIRARQDVEIAGADGVAALDAVDALRGALVRASGLAGAQIDGAVVGVPGAVAGPDGEVALATNVPGIEGTAFGAALRRRLGLDVTLENDINLAAVGERWRGIARGVDDFAFLSVGTGLGAGVVLHGELHRGRNGAAGELDLARAGRTDTDPCAAALSELAAAVAAGRGAETRLRPPFDTPSVFAAARSGDAVAREIVHEEAHRIALHIIPIMAVADVELVVIGGGVGANGDLLLDPIRALLAVQLPFAPRVEVSALGDAAVLTGALAVGLRNARDNVFVHRFTRASGDGAEH
jgi:predicted NBD/HSP70 family sugar kinase